MSTLLRLAQPSIPKVHAHWTATVNTGSFYLAMDFIPSKTLEQTLDEKGQIDWRQAAEWGMSLCKALAYLHEQTPPFLSRDVKPDVELARLQAGGVDRPAAMQQLFPPPMRHPMLITLLVH